MLVVEGARLLLVGNKAGDLLCFDVAASAFAQRAAPPAPSRTSDARATGGTGAGGDGGMGLTPELPLLRSCIAHDAPVSGPNAPMSSFYYCALYFSVSQTRLTQLDSTCASCGQVCAMAYLT